MRTLKQLEAEREELHQDVVLLEGRAEFAVDQLEFLRPRGAASADELLQAVLAKEAEQARLAQECEELAARVQERHGECCEEAHRARLAHLEAWLGAPFEDSEGIEASPTNPRAPEPKPPLALATPIMSPRSIQPIPAASGAEDSMVHAPPSLKRMSVRGRRGTAIGAPVRPGRDDGPGRARDGSDRSEVAVMPCLRQRRTSDPPRQTIDLCSPQLTPAATERILKPPALASPTKGGAEESLDQDCSVQ